MDILGLMKRGKSVGSDDPACVLATAIYKLQKENEQLKARVEVLEGRQGQPLRIGTE